MYVKKVGVAYNVNKKIAQWCQGGIHQILKVDTLYYHFQQKICIYIPNLTVTLWFYLTSRPTQRYGLCVPSNYGGMH